MNHDLDDAMRSGIIDEVPAEFLALGNSHGKRIGAMVEDAIVSSLDSPSIRLSPPMLARLNGLKEWLFDNVYLRYPVLYPDIPKAKNLVRELFLHYLEPGHLPEGFLGPQGALDYVAGMTDRFAMATYARLKLPEAFGI
jgi:dGTPase